MISGCWVLDEEVFSKCDSLGLVYIRQGSPKVGIIHPIGETRGEKIRGASQLSERT